jgi:hypothetical protein
MKKFILLSTALLMLVFVDKASAQISSANDRPYQKDTLVIPSKPYTKIDIDHTLQKHTDAERHQDSLKWKRKADSAATAAKQKAAEISAKVGAALSDCSLKNVKGPKGETVYVDEYDRRYYINKDGSKVFMKRPPVTAGKK